MCIPSGDTDALLQVYVKFNDLPVNLGTVAINKLNTILGVASEKNIPPFL